MKNLDDVLAHYGILGMKWGVRRDRATLDRLAGRKTRKPQPPRVTKATPGKRVRTAGGENNPPDEQHVKANLAKQKAKKSGVQALTNEELQASISRMRMETSFQKAAAEYNPTLLAKIQAKIKDSVGLDKGTDTLKKFANSPQGKELAKWLASGKPSDSKSTPPSKSTSSKSTHTFKSSPETKTPSKSSNTPPSQTKTTSKPTVPDSRKEKWDKLDEIVEDWDKYL